MYVRPFPGPGGKWQIQTEGGTEAVWARNGRELFYRNGDKMMAVAVETKTDVRCGQTQAAVRRPLRNGPLRFFGKLRRQPGRAAVPDD